MTTFDGSRSPSQGTDRGDAAEPTATRRAAALAREVADLVPGWSPADTPGLLAQVAQADPSIGLPALLAWLSLAACDMPQASAALDSWRAGLAACAPGERDLLPRLLRRRDLLVAEILQEARLAPRAAEAARIAIAGGDRPAALVNLRRNPGSYPAAVAVVARAATPPPSRGPDRAIPHVIVQGWFDAPMPADVHELIETWAHHHPTWQHLVFDTDSASAWIREHLGAPAELAFRSAPPVGKSNLFRYAYLSLAGGLWSDADDRCVSSLEPLILGRSLVVLRESLGAIADNLVAAAPGHPVLVATRDEAFRNVNDGFAESPWLANGPGVLTRHAAAWLAGMLDDEPSDFLIASGPRMFEYVDMHQPLAYKETSLAWDVPADPSAPLEAHLERPWAAPRPLSRRQRALLEAADE